MSMHRYVVTAALISILASGVMMPSFAQTKKPVVMPPVQSQSFKTAYQQQMETSAKMLSEVALAVFSLDFDLPEDALGHIEKAHKFIGDFAKGSPAVITSKEFKMGKETYKYKGNVKDFYVPVVDDVFMTRDYDIVMHRRKKSEVDEQDIVVGRYELSLNLKSVNGALDEAGKKIREGKLDKATADLDGIFKEALVREITDTNSLWAVHDNLIMTYNLLRKKNYEGAKFTLNHAAASLKKYERERGVDAVHSKPLKLMADEIFILQDELHRDAPGVFEKAEMEVEGWLHDIEDWYEHRKIPLNKGQNFLN